MNRLQAQSLKLNLPFPGCQGSANDSCKQQSMSDLHIAARNDDVGQLHVLLAKGADINCRDKHSRTPLHLAAWAGKLESVKALLAAKCNAGASAMDDTTALHFAAQKGHAEVCRQLLFAGMAQRPPCSVKYCIPQLTATQTFAVASNLSSKLKLQHCQLIWLLACTAECSQDMQIECQGFWMGWLSSTHACALQV